MSTYAGQDPIPTQPVVADEGAWPDLLTIPTDNAPITAANFNASIKGLADRTNWLARRQVNGLEGGEYDGELVLNNLHYPKADQYRYTEPTVFTVTVEGTPYRDIDTDPFWKVEEDTFRWTTDGVDAANAECRLCIPLHLPHAAALLSASVNIKGPPGHAAFPGGKPKMPTVKVQQRAVATGVVTTLQTFTDPSASVGVYQADHAIVCTLTTPHVVNRSAYVYFLQLASEDDGTSSGGEGGKYPTLYYGSTVTYAVEVAVSE